MHNLHHSRIPLGRLAAAERATDLGVVKLLLLTISKSLWQAVACEDNVLNLIT